MFENLFSEVKLKKNELKKPNELRKKRKVKKLKNKGESGSLRLTGVGKCRSPSAGHFNR